MSAIITHVLDTARGRPASGVPVRLSRTGPETTVVAESTTDSDGRVTDLGPDQPDPGTYQPRFDVAA
jgi:5-hydroxyisourate hydrolase